MARSLIPVPLARVPSTHSIRSKTFTIQGASDDKTSSLAASSNRGLMPRVFEYLMASIQREERKASAKGAVVYTCRASFLEVHNERIFDLLEPASSSAGAGASGALQLREDSKRGIYVEGLSEELVRTAGDCTALMERGIAARRVGETALNRESSRSHCVLSLTISSVTTHPSGTTTEKSSRFNLIDLVCREGAALGARRTRGQTQELAMERSCAPVPSHGAGIVLLCLCFLSLSCAGRLRARQGHASDGRAHGRGAQHQQESLGAWKRDSRADEAQPRRK